MKFASANFYLNIPLKAKYITRAKREYHCDRRELICLPQRGRGTTAVVDEEIEVYTALYQEELIT